MHLPHLPEEGDAQVVAGSHMWCAQVVVEEQEGEQNVVHVALVGREEDHRQVTLTERRTQSQQGSTGQQ